jgi:hypothetical protein
MAVDLTTANLMRLGLRRMLSAHIADHPASCRTQGGTSRNQIFAADSACESMGCGGSEGPILGFREVPRGAEHSTIAKVCCRAIIILRRLFAEVEPHHHKRETISKL